MAYVTNERDDARGNAAEAQKDLIFYRDVSQQHQQRAEAAERQIAALTAAHRTVMLVANEAATAWDADQDSRVGKLLRALAGHLKGYRADIDAVHAALRPAAPGEAQ